MIRMIWVWFSIMMATLMLGLLAFFTYPFDRKGRIVHQYARLWGKIALKVNQVRVTMEGMEKLDGKGPYIFMSNHQGYYDVFALLGHLPYQFKWFVKKELFSIPFFNWTMAAAGYISIDRKGSRETIKAMNQAIQKIRDGMSVAIFPEGSRSPDGSIQPFKKGGFTLAIKSQVPIVPIAINGSRDIMPKGKFTPTQGEIRILVDHPIETKSCSLRERESLMRQVRETICNNVRLISEKECGESSLWRTRSKKI